MFSLSMMHFHDPNGPVVGAQLIGAPPMYRPLERINKPLALKRKKLPRVLSTSTHVSWKTALHLASFTKIL